MSKIAQYLQEHILGEVTANRAVLGALSHDKSPLEITPEMVIYPRVTNDIRKVTRFAWQLAEKGHVLPITIRGGGTDKTGGAIGKGILLHTKAHLHNILEFDSKQKLLRLQPGTSTQTLNTALMLQGFYIPALVGLSHYGTVGGAVGKDSGGKLAGRYGTTGTWVQQLEIVLANGDVLQTERISKRELNKRKGMQTFEGEIYRSLDNLIEDNRQLIDEKIAGIPDTSGYSAIAKVKDRDGSFDLTPLFIGSQGTLGVVSEMIVKCDFVSMSGAVVVAAFTSKESARDSLDQLRSFEPDFLDYYDGELFEIAAKQGKKYSFYNDVDGGLAAVVVLGFNDFSDRARHKKLKKVAKALDKLDTTYQAGDGDEASELEIVQEVTNVIALPEEPEVSAVPLLDGAYIPPERFEEFSSAVITLAAKHHVQLPLHLSALDNIVNTQPWLQLHKVGDKQKILKLLDEYAILVANCGGILVAREGEGRIKANSAYAQIDDDVKELYAAIKAIFDPYNLLNPGVKQPMDMRGLVAQLRQNYDAAMFADEISVY